MGHTNSTEVQDRAAGKPPSFNLRLMEVFDDMEAQALFLVALAKAELASEEIARVAGRKRAAKVFLATWQARHGT